jgi:hypothetical protein
MQRRELGYLLGVCVVVATAVVGAALVVGWGGDAAAADEPPGTAELAFTDVADERGLGYATTESGLGNGNDGVYVADYDGDLREDVLLTGNESRGPVLYRNTGGDGSSGDGGPAGFAPSGQLPAVDGKVQSALWLDYDSDGWTDLLLLRREATPVFLENDGGDLSRADVGLGDETFDNPVGASAADADGDGRLELLVIQYGDWADGGPTGWRGPVHEIGSDNGNPNVYFEFADGEFVRDESAGIGSTDVGPHWSLAVSFRDLTGDGAPDIHVANDYYNDTLYVNRGDGTFARRTLGGTTDRNGMSSTVANVTGDSRPEVFVTNIHFPDAKLRNLTAERRRFFQQYVRQRLGKRMAGNNLLTAGDGDLGVDRGSLTNVAPERGVADGGWGWAASFGDLDSDGTLDLIHATQPVVTFDHAAPEYPSPMVWLGHDDGFVRQNATGVGLAPQNGRGLAGLDYQVDGARDVLIGTYGGPATLYRNDAGQGHSLQVLVGTLPGDHTAVGATVAVTTGDGTQRRVSASRADYQSQDTRVLHFGVGDATTVETVTVTWPDGTELVLEDVAVDQRVRVTPDGVDDRINYGE